IVVLSVVSGDLLAHRGNGVHGQVINLVEQLPQDPDTGVTHRVRLWLPHRSRRGHQRNRPDRSRKCQTTTPRLTGASCADPTNARNRSSASGANEGCTAFAYRGRMLLREECAPGRTGG